VLPLLLISIQAWLAVELELRKRQPVSLETKKILERPEVEALSLLLAVSLILKRDSEKIRKLIEDFTFRLHFTFRRLGL
jgi:hypothetical protein